MALVNVKFRNTSFNLECNNEKRIIELSEKLNQKAEAMSVGQNNSNNTDTKMAIITALMLEDELDALKTKASDARTNEDELNFNSTLIKLAEYIEGLADSIEKR